MLLKKELKEIEEILNQLQSEKRHFCFALSSRHFHLKMIDNAIVELKKEYAYLLLKQEKISACIKKHPLVRQVKKQSQELIAQSSLSLMQARNQASSSHGYQNWNDLIEQLSQELNDYLANDNLSLDKTIPQENQMTISMGKNQYGMNCFLKPEHWSAHISLINCPEILNSFYWFGQKTKVLIIDKNYLTTSENAIILSSTADWEMWQTKEQGLAYLNNENKFMSEIIMQYVENRIKNNNRMHELWVINASEHLDIIKPQIIAQIRSFNIHLVLNYSNLANLSSNEMIANNIQTRLFDTQLHHPTLLSDIFSCNLSAYQMPKDKSKMAVICQNRLTEIA